MIVAAQNGLRHSSSVYQEKENKDQNETPSHTYQNGSNKKTDNTKYWHEYRMTGTFTHCLCECKITQLQWRKGWQLLLKLHIHLTVL